MHFLHVVSREIKSLDLLGGGIYHMTNSVNGMENEAVQKSLGFKSIEDKWAGLAPYKYSLAIENAVTPDYWSEKIADCFLTWTLPIYYGCLNLEDYFPKQSFIRIPFKPKHKASNVV